MPRSFSTLRRGGLIPTGDVDASAWIEGKWKLVQEHASGEVELFDLSNDLGEENNLAEEQPEVRDQLLKKMNDHKAEWLVFERKKK